jgi:hypothetical protein
MLRYTYLLPVGLLALFLAAGCGEATKPADQTTITPVSEADKAKYLLAEEPAGAKPVLAVRQEAKDGDDVVIVGRIGGEAKPWVEGKAAFWIVDASLKSCQDNPGDNCATPWDYCCEPKEQLRQAMATVKVVDEQGKTVASDARQLLGVKELQTVVVRGQAKRDENGNLTVLATGLYVRR